MKLTLIFVSLFLTSFVSGQILNIPDANFKNALVNLPCVDIGNDYTLDVDADTNNDGEISLTEAQAVTSLQLMQQSIQSLEGIQYFTNLQILNIFQNDLAALDVSMLTQLQELECSMNQIAALNLGILPNLGVFNCQYNQLAALDFVGAPNVWFLSCDHNLLTAIDVSTLSHLRSFQCDNNLFTELDVSDHFELESLWCFDNQLQFVDVRNGQADNFVIFSLTGNPQLETFCIDSGDNFTMFYQGPVPSFCVLSTQEAANKTVGFYPNPAVDFLHFDQPIENLKIHDLQGRLVTKNTAITTL
jgi:hypothetical protein